MRFILVYVLSLVLTATLAQIRPNGMSMIEYSMSWDIAILAIVSIIMIGRTLILAAAYIRAQITKHKP